MPAILREGLIAIALALLATAPALSQERSVPEEATASPAVPTGPEPVADEGHSEPTDEALDAAVDEAADDAAPDPDDATEDVSPDAVAVLADPDIPREELELRLIPLTAAEHEELAEAWLAIVRAKTEAVVEQQLLVRGEDDDAAGTASDRIAELTEERRQLFDKFSVVLDSWVTKGGDTDVVMSYRT
jgi:small conductance mechanosensitive channel